MVLPARTVRVAPSVVGLEVEKGLLSPEVVRVDAPGQVRALVRLPPRYRSHEAAVAEAFGVLPVREAALVRGLKGVWRWLKVQLSRRRRDGSEAGLSPGAVL